MTPAFWKNLLMSCGNLLVSIGLLLSTCQSVLAQAQVDPNATKEAWVVSYALVILLVGLGLFVVSLPSRRHKKVKKK